jgi:hypothetical protein
VAVESRNPAVHQQDWSWEALEVGRVRTTRVHPRDGGSGAGLPAALGTVLQVLDGEDNGLLRVMQLEWSELAELSPDGDVDLRSVVTRRVASPDGATGTVHCAIDVLADSGQLLQKATLQLLVTSRTGSATSSPNADVGTRAWGDLLARRLESDAVFGEALGTWDGCLGIRSGQQEVQFRIYRGRVVEVASRTPHGPTFTVAAAERAWVELLTAASNDYFRRIMSTDDFTVHGSAYEYLRTTKAIVALVDCARALAKEQL